MALHAYTPPLHAVKTGQPRVVASLSRGMLPRRAPYPELQGNCKVTTYIPFQQTF